MLWLSACFVVLSLLAFTAYYFDKQAAIRGSRRTPESTLHTLSVLGGWPGAFLAQRILKHKSSKPKFKIIYWLTVCVNISVTVRLLNLWK